MLPGVVVSVLDADSHPLDVSASAADGTYTLKMPGPGRYTLKAEFIAFAPMTRELTVDQPDCEHRLDLSMTLASRAPQAAAATTVPSDDGRQAHRGKPAPSREPA